MNNLRFSRLKNILVFSRKCVNFENLGAEKFEDEKLRALTALQPEKIERSSFQKYLNLKKLLFF